MTRGHRVAMGLLGWRIRDDPMTSTHFDLALHSPTENKCQDSNPPRIPVVAD